MESHITHQNGRPTRNKQLEMQTGLRKYFERGISATVTSSKTGVNIKTVCKYFDEWAEQIRESESNDFLERQKNERAQIIVTFDEQILLVHAQLDDIEDQITKYKKENKIIPKHLLGLRLEISKYLSNLTEKKGLFMMQLTMDEALKKKIEEEIKHHEESREHH